MESDIKRAVENSREQSNSYTKMLLLVGELDETSKRTSTAGEKTLTFDLWKQGTSYSDIGRIIEAQPYKVFTVLRDAGGIKPRTRTKNAAHLTSSEKEKIGLDYRQKLISVRLLVFYTALPR
jgi:hypothetical protein